jgi:FixJ family two-component response regulator
MGRKILLVDDDGATRWGLAALLEESGYTVLAVSTLHAARTALVTDDPDLLITDIRLGAYNGLHLVVARRVPIPAIVITGFPDSALEAEARRMGADFLVKPISPAELLWLMERRLSEAARESYQTARRWQRKRLTTDLPAQVGDAAVRIVDVSYGGLRLAGDGTPGVGLAPSFRVTFPTAAVSVNARVVWQEAHEASWVCGAVITEDAESTWRELVDAAS